MNTVKLFSLTVSAILLVSSGCSTSKKIEYFQDMPGGHKQEVIRPTVITVRPGDQLSIVVFSDNPEVSSAFNLIATGYSNTSSNSKDPGTRAYTIDSQGDINMPVLGKINIAGMTREQISKTIETELKERNLLRQPVVNVSFYNMHINVIGEMGSVRQVSVEKDVVTLPEVLSQCGDLTINAKRDSVKVIREIDGNKVAFTVDMRSAKSFFESPVYYLQPNDLVYVKPNKQRANQSTPNANAILTPAFWISIITFLTSMGVLILKL